MRQAKFSVTLIARNSTPKWRLTPSDNCCHLANHYRKAAEQSDLPITLSTTNRIRVSALGVARSAVPRAAWQLIYLLVDGAVCGRSHKGMPQTEAASQEDALERIEFCDYLICRRCFSRLSSCHLAGVIRQQQYVVHSTKYRLTAAASVETLWPVRRIPRLTSWLILYQPTTSTNSELSNNNCRKKG